LGFCQAQLRYLKKGASTESYKPPVNKRSKNHFAKNKNYFYSCKLMKWKVNFISYLVANFKQNKKQIFVVF
jgi:hypothetical protein